jgi:amino acid transporter
MDAYGFSGFYYKASLSENQDANCTAEEKKIMEQKQVGQSKKSRGLNKADVFVLAFGAMIGWGWVVLSGEWIEKAGTLGAILGFIIGGILVLFVGLVYAELSAAMPATEGVLLFSKTALNFKASFVCTWSVVLGFLSVIAFEAVALPTVVTYLFPNYLSGYLYSVAGFDVYASWLAVGIGASLLVAVINYIGVKFAAVLQTVLTVVIMLIGVVLLGGTAVNGSVSNMAPLFSNGFAGILTVAVMTPFMYIGFDVIPQAAGEMDIPAKKIGSILVTSVMFAVIWYVLIIACVGADLTHPAMLESILPTADAMQAAFGGKPIMGKLLVIGGISGILTSWNAFYIGASRLLYAMANEGMLPKALGKQHARFHTPKNAILLIAIVTSLTPLLGKNMLTWLSNAGGFATVVTYFIVSISYLALRKKRPDMPRPFSIKRWRLVGIGSVALCILMFVLYMPGTPSALSWPYEWLIVAGWAILGLGLFLYARRSTRKKAKKDIS